MKQLLLLILLAPCLAVAQSGPPGWPGNGDGSTNGTPVDLVFTPPNTNLVTPSGSETLYVDSFPITPNPSQVYQSWATIQTAGLTVDTNGFIVDTNANPDISDGMMDGTTCGMVPFAGTNAFLITRGQFLVLLNNANGELQNTQFDVKVFRNTNSFAGVFGDTMAEADYASTDSNITLIPISGTPNLYQLSVNFPPCVCVAPRVVCIMTEPIDPDYQFSHMQLLQGTAGAPTVITALDYSLTPVANAPAMRLWTKQVNGVGVRQQQTGTPGLLALLTIPGVVIKSTTNPAMGFSNCFRPDEGGFADWDMTQDLGSFFKVELDNAQ